MSSYIPLSQREQWADITPIPQDDGPDPLVPIMYSTECELPRWHRDAMDHFRAISLAKEHSERALELTETIIRMNPAHYTVWQFRMATLLALNKDLETELELMNEFARENLKSYQVWHHRLLLLTEISPQSPSKEIDYIHDSLLPDPKNYHTWAYLHWLYSHFSSLGRISEADWDREVRWCEEMLRTDGRNNSAWGWRWFLMMSRPGGKGTQDGGKGEITYALKAIHLIPHNVSAWNYLRGILTHFKLPLAPLSPAVVPYTEGSTAFTTVDSSSFDFPLPSVPLPADTPLPVPLALEFQADALAEQGKTGEASAVFAELIS
ncbi:hypothetical protein JCM24511_07708 [Saitozyma sp. JCM 24511]|nr:hypothetical protein JCM24511_07708 [Saitozyma sp. JCM 24511]